MLSLILLLSLNSSQLQRAIPSSMPIAASLAAQAQVVKSETCQSNSLHTFDLLEIEGQKVNKLIYLQTKAILQDSRAAGARMELTSVFRSCYEQTQLRQSNCANLSVLAVNCNPPTEKAGESLHNYGMAVDFKCSDSAIFGQSSCYTWLKNNAAKYKFQQRDEEPWHWSFTGK